MRIPKMATALVLLGAVGLASAAYGIGSASGGGSATAGTDDSRTAARDFRPGPPPGFDELADRLGVDADALEDALRDFHEQERGQHRDEFAGALAKALGISAEKVEQAFEQLGDDHRSRFESRLAEELGVSADKVRSALEKAMDKRPDSPAGFSEALAGELGVSVAKLEEALDAVRPDPGERRRDHHRGAPLHELATALGVTRAELREALREVQALARSRWEQHEQELAAFLADRFGLDAGEVEDALAELPRPSFRAGPPGPGGPGPHGPGPGGPDGPGFGRD